MASITIRNLDEHTKAQLRVRAAHRSHSMEEEARQILRDALVGNQSAPGNLAGSIATRFRAFGGVELELPQREPMREPRTARQR